MKIVAFVPIKLNSQRLPHKNILPLNNHPLCWHMLNTLTKTANINDIYIYCSDESIKNYSPSGVHFLKRDAKLDQDAVKGFDIYSAFIKEVDADIYVLAHTTSPFIKPATIDHALSKVINEDYDSAFSAQKIQTFCWYNGMPINYNINDVPRTQDLLPVYVETSGFFIFKKEIFTQHHRRIGFKPYIQEITMEEAIDIDEKSDYEFAISLSKLRELGD